MKMVRFFYRKRQTKTTFDNVKQKSLQFLKIVSKSDVRNRKKLLIFSRHHFKFDIRLDC